jgi:hypothetical protein
LDILDTGGHPDFEVLQNTIVNTEKVSVYIAMYAVNNRASFDKVQLQINIILDRNIPG